MKRLGANPDLSEGFAPRFELLEQSPEYLQKLREGMVLWDGGAHIPVSQSLAEIVNSFIRGTDAEFRRQWKELTPLLLAALQRGDLGEVGRLKNKS